ncbi:MAG: flagellar protein FlaG [Candidatus Aureabacteria bacterium]|nr:flagellar protein FlaG [Candidatus Auribacterota bacterium]
MAVEDTDQVNAGVDPVESQVRYQRRKGTADVPKASVSSPATSVEDGITEKTKAGPIEKGSQPVDSFLKVKPFETLTKSQLQEVTEAINQELSFISTSIQFRIEEVEKESLESGKPAEQKDPQVEVTKKEIVVSVVDKRTGEVIRKIPPEDLLQSLYNASMFLGLVVDQVV